MFIAAAIQISQTDGFKGRLGLHALPQAECYYSEVCGMTELGQDPSKENLKYFEMTAAQAAKFGVRSDMKFNISKEWLVTADNKEDKLPISAGAFVFDMVAEDAEEKYVMAEEAADEYLEKRDDEQK